MQESITSQTRFNYIRFSMVFYSYISPCTSTIPPADAMSLATYIEEHKTRRPPDHLFSEWIQRPGSGGQLAGRDSSAKGRPFFAFRHNILYHVGSQSSLGHESRIIVPKCYDTLQDWLQPCVALPSRFVLSRAIHRTRLHLFPSWLLTTHLSCAVAGSRCSTSISVRTTMCGLAREGVKKGSCGLTRMSCRPSLPPRSTWWIGPVRGFVGHRVGIRSV